MRCLSRLKLVMRGDDLAALPRPMNAYSGQFCGSTVQRSPEWVELQAAG